MTWRIAGGTYTAALCALLLGCSEGSDPAGQIEVFEADSSGVAIVSILGSVSGLPIWMVTDTPDVVIGAAGNIVFGSIGEVALLSDGRLLVEDNQTDELRLFDENGRSAARWHCRRRTW